MSSFGMLAAGLWLLSLAALGFAGMQAIPAREGEGTKAQWTLALVRPVPCTGGCAADAEIAGVLSELGNFAGELRLTAVLSLASASGPDRRDAAETGGSAIQEAARDVYALLDPRGQIVARFDRSAEPRRMAARIRILMTGRFDPEIAETCSPQSTSPGLVAVRDRWEKGI